MTFNSCQYHFDLVLYLKMNCDQSFGNGTGSCMIYVLKIKFNLGDNHKASHQDPHKGGENSVLLVLEARRLEQ